MIPFFSSFNAVDQYHYAAFTWIYWTPLTQCVRKGTLVNTPGKFRCPHSFFRATMPYCTPSTTKGLPLSPLQTLRPPSIGPAQLSKARTLPLYEVGRLHSSLVIIGMVVCCRTSGKVYLTIDHYTLTSHTCTNAIWHWSVRRWKLESANVVTKN